MAARSIWRYGGKLAVAATALGGGAALASSDDPATALKLCSAVPVRLVRDSVTAASIAFDYEYSLWGLPEGSSERAKVKHEVHLRSARKLQELCFKNGGIYIKLGQHIGQLEYLVPQEYVQIMRESMLNKCPVSSYDQVCDVFKKELGKTPDQVFDDFDPVPIASASLAQVHVARNRDGQKVAVKVQHTHMTDTAAADHATVELLVNTLHWLFPSFDYSEKVLENFWKLSPHIANYIYAPKVYWNLSTSKLLIMEFVDGAQVNDVKSIRKLGIDPHEVSRLVSQAFAEMMFKHGFVHCDPHAANLLVRPVPSEKKSILGKRKPQLILIDHGLYKELDATTKFNYAALWKALIFADANAIKEYSVKLGAGEDLYVLFAGILTMRPWNRVTDRAVDHLVIQGTDGDRSELQMYASQYFPQITELLRRLPRVILLMLKTNDCLRAVNNCLGSSPESFVIIGRVSSKAVIEAKLLQSKSFLRRLSVWLEEILLEVRLFSIEMFLWLLQIRKALFLA
ncbi:putative ABC1 protein [Citrus sinensis]|nr:putative ABC1 protein [Citrus sinensis]